MSEATRYDLAIVILVALAFLESLSTGWVGTLSWSILLMAVVAAIIAFVGIQEGKFTGSVSTSTLVTYAIGAALVVVGYLSVQPHITYLVAIAALIQGLKDLAVDLGFLSAGGQTPTPAAAGPPAKP
jgi:hypothetical protein